jgi:hypothetical protein
MQRRSYGFRIDTYIIPQISFFGLVAFLFMLQMNASTHTSYSSQIVWIRSGIVAGLLVGVWSTQRQLNSLTGKSETGRNIPATTKVSLVIGGFTVFIALFFVAVLTIGLPSTAYVEVFNSFFCAGLIFCLSRIFLLLAWEKNHNLRLYQKGSRFYAVPKPSRAGNQYYRTR